MDDPVPNLDRASELLWQTGHPRIAEALEKEVLALIEKCERLERIRDPRAVPEPRGIRV